MPLQRKLSTLSVVIQRNKVADFSLFVSSCIMMYHPLMLAFEPVCLHYYDVNEQACVHEGDRNQNSIFKLEGLATCTAIVHSSLHKRSLKKTQDM